MDPHLIVMAPRFRVIDQFNANPASTSENVTRHHLVFNTCLLQYFSRITRMTLDSGLVLPSFWYWSNWRFPVVLCTLSLFIFTNPWDSGGL